MKYRDYFMYLLILMYLTGAVGFVLHPGFFLPFTPSTLVYTGFVFILYQPIRDSAYLIWFSAVALMGFVAEVAGVATGYVFGNYTYGDTLGYKLLGVPLTISLNWTLLIGSAVSLASPFARGRWQLALAASIIVTLIDVLIERLAPKLEFWIFEGGTAGWHNYAGWMIVSFAGAYIAAPALREGHRGASWAILILQVYFFGLIYILT